MKLQFNIIIKNNKLTSTEKKFIDQSEPIIELEIDEQYTLDSALNYSSTDYETLGYKNTLMSSASSYKDNNIKLLLADLIIIIKRLENYYGRELLKFYIQSRKNDGLIDIVDQLETRKKELAKSLEEVLKIKNPSEEDMNLRERIDLSNEIDDSFIDEINKYIEENIGNPELSVCDLCKISGMSRTPFYHKLKFLVGLSPSNYIRSIRLKTARTLLKNRNNNISEVAYSVGFSNPKYFSTSFKKYFGQSPSTFVTEIRSPNL